MSDIAAFSAQKSATGNRPGLPMSTVLRSLKALFGISLDRNGRSKKMIALAALYCVPWILAVIIRQATKTEKGFLEIDQATGRPEIFTFGETGLILTIFPYVLVPLACLLYGVGMVQDEIEEQTLTYLLVRPIPRWSIYLVKETAAALSLMLLVAVFVPVTYFAVFIGCSDFWSEILVRHALVVTGAFCFAILAYTAVFGFISLLIRKSIVVGVLYIMVLEGFVGSLPFVIREGTILFYFRVLVCRWVPKFNPVYWEINLADAPSTTTCVLVLFGVFTVFTTMSCFLFRTMEFRVKTPEGK